MNRPMIFRDNAPKYHEAGIPVIPLKGKVPIVKDWQAWSFRNQTFEEMDWLVSRYPAANIGAVLGQWACALDVDTDNFRILSSVPYSPFRRRGKKGFAAIFRCSEWENDPGRVYPVEVLNRGRQVVLPPSIHPDTGEPYVWIGEENLLNAQKDELPILSDADLTKVHLACREEGVYRKPVATSELGAAPVCLTDTGRNNRLVSIAYAMACDGNEEYEAANRLLELDKKEHKNPWFSDQFEPHRGKDPLGIALRMYRRALAASKRRGDHAEILMSKMLGGPNGKA